MITIAAQQSILAAVVGVYSGNAGYGNWGFSAYYVACFTAPGAGGSVQTSHLSGSSNHGAYNPCDHLKMSGNIVLPFPAYKYENLHWVGGIGDALRYLDGPLRGYVYLGYGHSSSTEWLYRYNATGFKDTIYWSVDWDGSVLSVENYRRNLNGDIIQRTQWRATYRRTTGNNLSGLEERRSFNFSSGSWNSWTVLGTHKTQLISVNTGITPAETRYYRDYVSAVFHNWVFPKLSRIWEPLTDPDSAYYAGKASQVCANEFNAIESNVIANALELPEVGSTIPNIVNDISSPSARSAADAWLNYRYGDGLTYADAKQILSSLKAQVESLSIGNTRKRNGFASHDRILRGYQQRVSYGCTIVIENGGIDLRSTLQRIDELGSLPNVERAWDLVPYSFVVDWFLNVSDCANIIDSWFKTRRMNIKVCIQSVKGELILPSQALFGFGEGKITLTHYSRTIGSTPAMPVMDLDHLVSTPSWKNFLDGSALIIGAH